MANKQIIVTWLLLGIPAHLCNGKCAEGEFAMANYVCCSYCAAGWFAAANCTEARNEKIAAKCEQCSECGIGQRTVSNCTSFSDTVCENQVLSTPMTIAATTRLPGVQSASVIYTVSLYVVPSVALMLILAGVLWKLRSTRRPSADPAREPFNIQKLRV